MSYSDIYKNHFCACNLFRSLCKIYPSNLRVFGCIDSNLRSTDRIHVRDGRTEAGPLGRRIRKELDPEEVRRREDRVRDVGAAVPANQR